jgi:hypothetical protein
MVRLYFVDDGDMPGDPGLAEAAASSGIEMLAPAEA